jgi:hypothetical protein
MDATRRARERALHSLKQLHAEAEAAPPPPPPVGLAALPTSFQTISPQIGFVPPNPLPAPPHPLPQDSAHSPAPVRIGFVPQPANSPAVNPRLCFSALVSASPRLCGELPPARDSGISSVIL